ncbi:MAG: prepilin peptidase [Candidatus Micrarchaeia archaeon]
MITTFFPQITMNYELIRILIAIIFTSITAYFDIFNKKNIPNTLLYIFLIISLFITFVDFNIQLIFYSLICAVIIGILGYLLYKAGQLGGADVFILCSLSLLLPIQPTLFTNKPLMSLPFIFSIITISGLTFMIYILIKYTPIILKRKEKIEKKHILYSFLLVFIFLIILYLSIKTNIISKAYTLLIGFLIFVSIYFSIFKNRLLNCLIEKIPLNKIEVEDVIAIEQMDKKLVEKYKIPKVITEKDLKRLKLSNIKLYPVYTKLPMFIPFILIGLLISIYFGDILYILTSI